jgi:HK97 family phage portal protein
VNLVQRAVQFVVRAAGLSPVYDNRGWYPWRIREPYTGAWQRNDEWTVESVLAHHAVYACISRISQDVGKLRPRLVEQDDDGIWSEIESSAFSPVLRRPNRYQNHIQFKEWATTSKLTHGNTYILLERDQRQVVVRMYVLDPTRVRVMIAPDGDVFYDLSVDNLAGLEFERLAVPASEIIHDRINCLFHPLVGVSPIYAAGMAAHIGLRIQSNSADFFTNGSNPSGILTAPAHIPQETADRIKDHWERAYTGTNSGKVAVLGDGLSFEAMRMTSVDSQLIEQLKWSADTVCSTFHVPPWKVHVGQQPAYTKPELAAHQYYSDCLQSHIETFELCMDEALGLTSPTGGRRMGVELDLDGLLRMDEGSLVGTLTTGIKGSLYRVNEARLRVNLPPVDGGNEIWGQQQDTSLPALARRDREQPALPGPVTPEPQQPEPAARFARKVKRRARILRIKAAA